MPWDPTRICFRSGNWREQYNGNEVQCWYKIQAGTKKILT